MFPLRAASASARVTALRVRARFFSFGFVAVAAACGGDGGGEFDPCGGDPIGGWELVSADVVDGDPDACGSDGSASGTVFFNDNGRYSINAQIRGWKKSSGEACGFTTAFGGFYRVDGDRLCFGDSSATGDAIPCGEARPTTQHAVADFCVKNDRLRLRSSDLLFLRFPANFELARRPAD